MRQLPFQDVIDLIGRDAAQALVARYGGTTLYIPVRRRRGGFFDELCQSIGHEAAELLTHTYASLNLAIPVMAGTQRQNRDRQIQRRFDELTGGGLSARKTVTKLAREFGLVETSVWRALKRVPSISEGE